MLAPEIVQQLQRASLADRIQVIEELLQSLKNDIASPEASKMARKTFTVRTFNLGGDISFDREEAKTCGASVNKAVFCDYNHKTRP